MLSAPSEGRNVTPQIAACGDVILRSKMTGHPGTGVPTGAIGGAVFFRPLAEGAGAAKKGDPTKANGLCGERRSQDTGGIFRLREMKRCVLCFDELGECTP